MGLDLSNKSNFLEAQKGQMSLYEIKDLSVKSSQNTSLLDSIVPLSIKPYHILASYNHVKGQAIRPEEIEEIDLLANLGASALMYKSSETSTNLALENIKKITSKLNIPVVLNDLIIDEYQIWQANLFGVSSVTLDADRFERAELQYFIEVGREIGMEAIVCCNSIGALETALSTDSKVLSISGEQIQFEQKCVNLIKKYASGRIMSCFTSSKTRKEVVNLVQKGYKAIIIKNPLEGRNLEKSIIELLRSK
jgi:indole-3-glycerol phosphate synthase